MYCVLTLFLLFQHAEGFAGEGTGSDAGGVALRVKRVADLFPGVKDVFQFAFGQVGGVEDVTQLLAGEAVEAGVVRIQFGAEQGTALVIPLERR